MRIHTYVRYLPYYIPLSDSKCLYYLQSYSQDYNQKHLQRWKDNINEIWLNSRTLDLGFPYQFCSIWTQKLSQKPDTIQLYIDIYDYPNIFFHFYIHLCKIHMRYWELLKTVQNHWIQASPEIMPLNRRPLLLLSTISWNFPVVLFHFKRWCLDAYCLKSPHVWFLSSASWVVDWVFCLYKRGLGILLYSNCNGSVPT